MTSPAPKLNSSLLDETQSRFGVGEHFARAYLSYWTESRERTFRSLGEILGAEDPYPMWFEFAMSTNGRGGQLAKFLEPYLPERRGRYLDVGCGFGGCVRAFADLGFDVCGVEIDPQRVQLSRANAADGALDDCVHDLDILAEGAAERLGRFDMITCTDVIEHVLDVPLALRRMAGLLEPGGTLVLEIPNKDSLHFVNSDGHFNLYGITQLDRRTSIRYHERFFSFDYDVGYYFPAEYYVEKLSQLGIQAEYVNYPMQPARPLGATKAQVAGCVRGYFQYLRSTLPKLPFGVNLRLHWALFWYGMTVGKNLFTRTLGLHDAKAFQQRYLTDFWLLVARKPAS